MLATEANMKRLATVAISLFAVLALTPTYGLPQAQSQPGTKYSGEIIYADGHTTPYTSYWSSLAGDKFPYSRDVTDMKDGTLRLPMVRLVAVFRIDFIEPSEEEKHLLEQQGNSYPASVRKANVTFRDKKKLNGVFLHTVLSGWQGPDEEGSLGDPKIAAMTVRVSGK
jgi:hypothetical protein